MSDDTQPNDQHGPSSPGVGGAPDGDRGSVPGGDPRTRDRGEAAQGDASAPRKAISEEADFSELTPGEAQGEPSSLSMLYDLSLPVVIELGRTRMPLQEILELGRGSVVELDRLAGEPIDVFVADRRFAEGEVVVLGEQFGVRLTRILAPEDPKRQFEA